jgi:hypothetical protein
LKTTHRMLVAKEIWRPSNAVVTAALQECIPEHFDTTDSVCKAVHHSQMVGQQRNEHPHHTPQQEAATQPRPSTGGVRPTAVNSSSASHAAAVYYAAIMYDIGNTYVSALHKGHMRHQHTRAHHPPPRTNVPTSGNALSSRQHLTAPSTGEALSTDPLPQEMAPSMGEALFTDPHPQEMAPSTGEALFTDPHPQERAPSTGEALFANPHPQVVHNGPVMNIGKRSCTIHRRVPRLLQQGLRPHPVRRSLF